MKICQHIYYKAVLVLRSFRQRQQMSFTAAREFSLLSDETTDIADRAELAIFIRYVDSDCHQVKEDFLGVIEVAGSKEAEVLCQITCEILREKGVDINQIRFNSSDGTNTMSGKSMIATKISPLGTSRQIY